MTAPLPAAGRERARLALTIDLPNGAVIGPEAVALLDAIGRSRSIVGAARALGRSYRKTWLMVDALNRMFESRVVDTFPGRRGAGAEVTAFGLRLAALYRSAERRAEAGAARALEELVGALDWAYVADGAAPAAAEPTEDPEVSPAQATAGAGRGRPG